MIKDLYHGKVFPSEKIPNHSNLEYEKLSARFEKTLSQEQLEIFHQLSDLCCNALSYGHLPVQQGVTLNVPKSRIYSPFWADEGVRLLQINISN